MDIDDDIWQDVGLTDENDENVEIPAWLGDEYVRKGIKSLLDLDRCMEERRRLISECISMRQWMCEEWVIVTSAVGCSLDDPDVVYQLNERRKVLLRLCVAWDAAVKIIPVGDDLPWGPDLAELANARLFEYNESVNAPYLHDPVEEDMEEDAEDEVGDEVENEVDAAFIDELEIDSLAYEFLQT